MFNQTSDQFDVESLVKSYQASVNELSPIFCDDCMRDVEMAYNVSPNKILNIFGQDGKHRLDLNPFCKVVSPFQEKLTLSLPQT